MDRGIKRAKELRKSMSLPEVLLWQKLRGRNGKRPVKRQVPIGPYIADFLIPSCSLIIEVDGQVHEDSGPRDLRRDAFLAKEGFRVERIAARRVLQDPGEVAELILALCDEIDPPKA